MNTVVSKSFFAVAALALCSSCAHLEFWKSDDASKTAETGESEHKEPATSKEGVPSGGLSSANVKSGSVSELELKQAKLWARVDELEDQIKRQRERIKILERGLMLGILPDELKGEGEGGETSDGSGSKGKGHKNSKGHKKAKAEPVADVDDDFEGDKRSDHDGPDDAAAVAAGKQNKDSYEKQLASAHDQYRAGRYGKAIVEFTELGKTFADQIENGVNRFWIARCWIGLKEFQTARQLLVDYVKDFPAAAWTPRAKLELSRVEFQLGFKEKATQRLRELIQDHPSEDAAEMAKMELNNMQKTL